MNEQFDIAVVGGGAAGIAAAICAARADCKTLLLDKNNSAGGTGGFSGLTTLCGLYDDVGNFLNDGFAREFAEAISETAPLQTGKVWVLPYRPEKFRVVAEKFLAAESRLQTRWNSPLESAVVENGQIISINDFRVGAVIDCSGTAEVARKIGIECLETDETTQASAVIFPLQNVAREMFTPAAAAQVLLPLVRAGFPPVNFQSNLEPNAITAKFTGQPEQVPALIEFLRANISGFENCSSPSKKFPVARRAGRMIVGQYILTGADVLGAKKFPDAIAKCAWPVEQWNAAGESRLRYLPPGAHYEIPARSLRAAKIKNLFMAGKSLSADADAVASARVMGCCLATGAAAGNLAAKYVESFARRMTGNFEQLWAETFRHAKKNSPFYRELFRGVKTVPSLNEISTVDKSILSARNLDFLCVPRKRVIEIVTTSGTTGQPLLWMLTESDARRLALNEKISFECAGLTARDTVLVAVALDRCFIAGLAYTTGLRELGCAVVRVGASSATLVLETIARVQPTAIVAVPSFLRHVADKAREMKFDLKNCSVKKAICIGEPIRDRNFQLNKSGGEIEKTWGAKVFSTYGVTELANSLCECGAGAGGHLHDQQLHVEILDDAGNILPDSEIGEIVATTFGVEAMPLIRYRTGDCAALFSKKCKCGRTTPRLSPIVGRKNQKLKFKGASLFPSTLALVLEETKNVEAFVIVARKENELSDSIEVLIHGNAKIETLRDALQARAKIAPQIRRTSRAEIEALQMPPSARKRRTFVDLR